MLQTLFQEQFCIIKICLLETGSFNLYGFFWKSFMDFKATFFWTMVSKIASLLFIWKKITNTLSGTWQEQLLKSRKD